MTATMSDTTVDVTETTLPSDVYRFVSEPLYAVPHNGMFRLTFNRPEHTNAFITVTRQSDGETALTMPALSGMAAATFPWGYADRVPEFAHVIAQVAEVNPAEMGLVRKDLPEDCAYAGQNTWAGRYGVEEDFSMGFVSSGATWFAPHADPSAPYTPYLELCIDQAYGRLPNVKWVSRQVGVDTEFGSLKPLLEAEWNDVEGIRAHVTTMLEETDNETFKAYRALVDSPALKQFAEAQEKWDAYRAKWEEAKPRSRRVPTQAREIMEEVALENGYLVSPSRQNAYGFGGAGKRKGDANNMKMARRNVALSTGFRTSWRTSVRGTQDEAHRQLAHKLQKAGLNLHVLRNGNTYVVTPDPEFYRENFYLMQARGYGARNWREHCPGIQRFDTDTNVWAPLDPEE